MEMWEWEDQFETQEPYEGNPYDGTDTSDPDFWYEGGDDE